MATGGRGCWGQGGTTGRQEGQWISHHPHLMSVQMWLAVKCCTQLSPNGTLKTQECCSKLHLNRPEFSKRTSDRKQRNKQQDGTNILPDNQINPSRRLCQAKQRTRLHAHPFLDLEIPYKYLICPGARQSSWCSLEHPFFGNLSCWSSHDHTSCLKF